MAIDLHWIFGIRYYWASLEIPENFVRIIDSNEIQNRMTDRNSQRNFKIFNISGLIFNALLGIVLGVSFYEKITNPSNNSWISCFFVVELLMEISTILSGFLALLAVSKIWKSLKLNPSL